MGKRVTTSAPVFRIGNPTDLPPLNPPYQPLPSHPFLKIPFQLFITNPDKFLPIVGA